MSALLLVVLIVVTVYFALRLRALEGAVTNLARIVDKPKRHDRAIQKDIRDLEDRLDHLRDLAEHGAADRVDFDEVDAIREKLDRRLRALAGPPRGSPPDPPRE